MSRCPHCNGVLKDKWVISQGAALMGKKGAGKKRSSDQARAAARARWGPKKRKKDESTK